MKKVPLGQTAVGCSSGKRGVHTMRWGGDCRISTFLEEGGGEDLEEGVCLDERSLEIVPIDWSGVVWCLFYRFFFLVSVCCVGYKAIKGRTCHWLCVEI